MICRLNAGGSLWGVDCRRLALLSPDDWVQVTQPLVNGDNDCASFVGACIGKSSVERGESAIGTRGDFYPVAHLENRPQQFCFKQLHFFL